MVDRKRHSSFNYPKSEEAPSWTTLPHKNIFYVKSGVYSFGIVLLEILTGLRAFDVNCPKAKRLLVELARPLLSSKRKLNTITDSRLEDNYSVDSAFQIAQLALNCLQRTPYKRPSMTELVEELESIEAANANRIPRGS
ncbi:probable serine/threonine-protein kinase PIX13 [Syzygium oleosum]|uniref:probable serine/threonine-protein kinase PIX13 n=1 Tax=Syzygium oleosum TaxID=219896 RepID=UPI0024B9EC3A|nr:probable serine/threonine-protein kinase PIX13 [Syzygium oleosum]